MERLAVLGCCDSQDMAFLAIEYPALDGTIHSEGGRVCRVHGIDYAAEIPPDVGPITIRIFDWRGPRVSIGVHSRDNDDSGAREANAA